MDALRTLAREVKPKLITVGGSLNLFPHPVAEIRAIADEVGAKLLFDAAHLSGMIAGRAWRNRWRRARTLMTMSTYKSLGGPPGGLVVTNDAALAERLDAIAYPGLTANFDAGKAAALAVTLLDWKRHGHAYAQTMCDTARALAAGAAAAGPAGVRGGARRHHLAPVRHRGGALGRRPGGGQTHGAGPGCWPAASACRSRRWPATSTACVSACPRSCGWA